VKLANNAKSGILVILRDTKKKVFWVKSLEKDDLYQYFCLPFEVFDKIRYDEDTSDLKKIKIEPLKLGATYKVKSKKSNKSKYNDTLSEFFEKNINIPEDIYDTILDSDHKIKQEDFVDKNFILEEIDVTKKVKLQYSYLCQIKEDIKTPDGEFKKEPKTYIIPCELIDITSAIKPNYEYTTMKIPNADIKSNGKMQRNNEDMKPEFEYALGCRCGSQEIFPDGFYPKQCHMIKCKGRKADTIYTGGKVNTENTKGPLSCNLKQKAIFEKMRMEKPKSWEVNCDVPNEVIGVWFNPMYYDQNNLDVKFNRVQIVVSVNQDFVNDAFTFNEKWVTKKNKKNLYPYIMISPIPQDQYIPPPKEEEETSAEKKERVLFMSPTSTVKKLITNATVTSKKTANTLKLEKEKPVNLEMSVFNLGKSGPKMNDGKETKSDFSGDSECEKTTSLSNKYVFEKLNPSKLMINGNSANNRKILDEDINCKDNYRKKAESISMQKESLSQ